VVKLEMLSVDTNILFPAFNYRSPFQRAPSGFLESHVQDTDFCVCELAPMELYIYWRIIDYPGNLMSKIWPYVAEAGRGRPRILDARSAYTLGYHGGTEFATRHLDHLRDFGFARLWDPLA
jgi:hypothetical protein